MVRKIFLEHTAIVAGFQQDHRSGTSLQLTSMSTQHLHIAGVIGCEARIAKRA